METADQKTRRVAIVDDSRTSQAILEALFSERLEFDVVGVANAADGEDLIRRLAPDLVAIDLCMPYIDDAIMPGMISNRTFMCKVVVSDQALANIGVAKKLEAFGAALCIGKREFAEYPIASSRKIIRACKRVEDAVTKREDSQLVLCSNVSRKPPASGFTSSWSHSAFPY